MARKPRAGLLARIGTAIRSKSNLQSQVDNLKQQVSDLEEKRQKEKDYYEHKLDMADEENKWLREQIQAYRETCHSFQVERNLATAINLADIDKIKAKEQ